MKISANMLYEAVREQCSVSLVGTCSPGRNLRFLSFLEDEELSRRVPGGIYLARPECLPRQVETPDVLFVTRSSGSLPQIRGCPLLVFHQDKSPQTLFNLLQGVLVRFCSWEEQLDEILRQGSNIQKMIDQCEPMFHHPLCVVDSSLHFLGYSGSFMSEEREIFFPGGSVREADIQQREDPPVPDLFYRREQDLRADLTDQGYLMGTLYMLRGDREFTETERLLFDLLREKLSRALQNLSLLNGLYQNSFRQNLLCLFQSGQVEDTRLWESLRQWGGRQGDVFICYKVKAAHINQKINAEYVCRIFETVLYHAVAFWQDGVLVVLADVSRNQGTEAAMHEKMKTLLSQLGLRAGVSLPFTEVDRAWYYFRQACCAFDEGYPRQPQDTLYFFRDYVPGYMLHHALGEFPRAYLMDPGLQRLAEHDRLYSVSYLETLSAFFGCRMNMSQTAEALGIHRTSLNSRIQKIVELLDHEMDQEYLLYLQMMLVLMKQS